LIWDLLTSSAIRLRLLGLAIEIETLACRHITGAIRMVQTIDSLEKKTLLIAPKKKKKKKDIPDVKHALVKVPSIYTRENVDLAEHSSLENCFFWGL
jgi:hypothetical protein